jgi:glycine/D-amino acid oxidase-like deaminating enzyme
MAGLPRQARGGHWQGDRLPRRGTLAVALTRDDVERLRFSSEFQRDLGIELAWLIRAEARGLEPHLSPRNRRGSLEPTRSSGRQPVSGHF